MAEMVCPYDQITLKLALLGIEQKLEDSSLAEKINNRLSEFLVEDKAELNKRLAEHNGVTVADIISSPNYKILSEEYSQELMKKAIEVLKEESFTDKEAWALLAIGTGALKI